MNTIRRTAALCLVVTGMFVLGCALSTPPSTPTASAKPADETPTDVPARATETLRPTQGPTATVWPPVFDPWALEISAR